MALDCRPELATKQSMKAENIRCFGDVMRNMLDACGKKPLMTTINQQV